MPFPPQTPIPFARESIIGLQKFVSGCYGLRSRSEIVYVGQAIDLRERLMDYITGNYDNPKLRPILITDVLTVVVPVSQLDSRELALILEYNPVCNRRVG